MRYNNAYGRGKKSSSRNPSAIDARPGSRAAGVPSRNHRLPVKTTPAGTKTWTASEFVAHQKTPGWYGLLALAALVLSGLIYLLTRDIISASVVIVAALFFGRSMVPGSRASWSYTSSVRPASISAVNFITLT